MSQSAPGADASNAPDEGAHVAVVTGGARRVGAALVEGLARDGYQVVLHHGHSPDAAAQVAMRIQQQYRARVTIVQADLAQPEGASQVIDHAMQHFGRVDVVVSSASLMRAMPFDAVTVAAWDETANVNLRAPFFLLQAAARVLTEGGVFIQIADHLAHETAFPQLMAHAVTKAGLEQLVRAGADLLAPRCRMNAVAPGLVLPPDDMSPATLERFLRDVPLGRIGSPDDVVDAVRYLIRAAYVTGTILTVDGGRHLRR
ncbi:MAG: hypothetical protein RLZZ621_1648 [Gemmatimonadota bacterium]|jgi:pteridine reductase